MCSCFDMTGPCHSRGVGISFSYFFFLLFKFLCTSSFSVCKKLLPNLHIVQKRRKSPSAPFVISTLTITGLAVWLMACHREGQLLGKTLVR